MPVKAGYSYEIRSAPHLQYLSPRALRHMPRKRIAMRVARIRMMIWPCSGGGLQEVHSVMPVIEENCSWHVNYRSRTYSIARALQRCGGCARLTPVVAVVLPPGHETLAFDEDADEESAAADVWEVRRNRRAPILYRVFPGNRAAPRLQGVSQHYQLGHAEAEAHCDWTNQCAFCGAAPG